MDFGKVLSRSWEIIWKYKVLWIFGILASFGANFNVGGNFNYRVDQGDIGNLPPNMERFFTEWTRNFEGFFTEENMGWIIAIICIALLIGILFWAVSVFGRVGLIKGVINVEAGKAIAFRSLASDAWTFLGRALGLSILFFLVPFAFVILSVIVFGLIGVATMGIGLLCLLPLICLIIPIALLYYVYTEMVQISLVREDLGIGQAISRGWEVFRSNFGNLIGMGLILLVGGFLVGLVLLIPAAAIAAPFFLALFSQDPNALGSGITFSIVLFCIALPFLILFNGVVTSYIQSAWTLAYMQITGTKPRASRAKA
jgi:hypothetical protein